jgi:hypothetical protein
MRLLPGLLLVAGILLTACQAPVSRFAPPDAAAPSGASRLNSPSNPSGIQPVITPSSHPDSTAPESNREATERVGESTEALAPLQVDESRLVGYSLMGDLGTQSFILTRGRPENSKLWLSPGYWGYQIIRIEGKGVASLSLSQQMHLFGTLPEPMHLVIRSASGRIVEVKAVTHID